MKILHYGLGFPPQRSGGLTTYYLDLAKEQACQGKSVDILYPGNITLFGKKTSIKQNNKKSSKNIRVFEIVNPLPMTLMGGFCEPTAFMTKLDSTVFRDFLGQRKPDVIHVHTFYGLHKEFLEAAKELRIHLIYTTHDYYGLCANPTFFYQNKDYSQQNSVDLWSAISAKTMALWKLRLMQTTGYPLIRSLSKKMKIARDGGQSRHSEEKTHLPQKTRQLTKLKAYYQEMFSIIDTFHFNSSVAEEIYRKNIVGVIKGEKILITNRRINSQKQVEKSEATTKRIAYIGPYEDYKGYQEFIRWAKKNVGNTEISFHVWGDSKQVSLPEYITNHGRFSSLEEVYTEIDILIVPSLWKETFGFNVIEALCTGTPVFVSKNVGAKDMINDAFIFEKIEEINLEAATTKVNSRKRLDDISEHTKKITALYSSY